MTSSGLVSPSHAVREAKVLCLGNDFAVLGPLTIDNILPRALCCGSYMGS